MRRSAQQQPACDVYSLLLHRARHWPSPVVFHDMYEYNDSEREKHKNTLTADAENVRNVDIEDFRVFDNKLYKGYEQYRKLMPDFTTLHMARKPAGLQGAEGETQCEALAFQGTMKVIDKDTRHEIEVIQGSGHHGSDWTGVASVRAGKGYKVGGPLSLQRMV